MNQTIAAVFQQDGGCTLLARLCTRDGTGAASPVPAEGNLNLPADYQGGSGSIRVEVYDAQQATDAGGGRTPTYSQTVNPAVVVQAALQTAGVWANVPDGLGGNFLCDLPAAAFPSASTYRVEVKATTSGGTAGVGVWEGPARPLFGS